MDSKLELLESQAVNIKSTSICRTFTPDSIPKWITLSELPNPTHMYQGTEIVKQLVADAM